MWPRMLLEFLPHLTRLIPAADKYLSSRQADDKAHEAALASLAGELRGGFAKVAQEQAGLRADLQEQMAGSVQAAAEAARARTAVEALESRFAALEKRSAFASAVLWIVLALLAVILILLVVLLRK